MSQPSHRVHRVALLLAGSGFAALVYQVAWMRSLRLTFGASTTATAAVLAIFLGGLGLGSRFFGARADRAAQPLRMYGLLELGITAATALSPLLIEGVRWSYLALGGQSALGVGGSTAVRLLLSALVLGLPTFLMGGTLPAAVRAVEHADDEGRRSTGLLYGLNTAGAVVGVLTANFFALEAFGTRGTLWLACLLNGLVAAAALLLARRAAPAADPTAVVAAPAPSPPPAPAATTTPGPRVRFLFIAAAVVGFAFVAMELVWYRMLAPILGGSSYTFGLILALVLLGIAIGGSLYGLGATRRRPRLYAFALTCGLEALLLIAPFALGDTIAVVAMYLRPLGNAGFIYLVAAWTLVAALVVLPASIIAGYQFPLLVALLGKGDDHVGSDLGMAYAWNTAGSIIGSLAGGFLLIPWLSAPGSWVFVALVLAALSLWALALSLPRRLGAPRMLLALGIIATTLGLAAAQGPTAAWRHSPIGAARMSARLDEPNDVRNVLQNRRRAIAWEADGTESSVALHASDGLAFLIHGKSDGNARGDAATQVFGGLVGAALHENPTRSLVVGLGTGSTAGWMARIDSMQRVDVVELEQVIEHVARACEPVNEAVLDNPKVHVLYEDAREALLTSDADYDLVFSEPSNPYRAGIASLFTTEFYEAVASRLGERGVFMQWLQAYEVDALTVQTVYATVAGVFPHVETWELQIGSDMLLVASRSPLDHDVARLRRVLASEPYDRALQVAWGVAGLEGFYSGFVAGPELARAVAARPDAVANTDDMNVIEFDFARNMGRRGLFSATELRTIAERSGSARPDTTGGEVDWGLVAELRGARAVADEQRPLPLAGATGAPAHRTAARHAYSVGDLSGALSHWSAQEAAPEMPIDVAMVAEASAHSADPRFEATLDRLTRLSPTTASAVRARRAHLAGQTEAAAAALAQAIRAYRTDPWPYRPLMARALELVVPIAERQPALGRALFTELAEPFSVSVLDHMRRTLRLELARRVDFPGLCVEALADFEPHVPWERQLLTDRYVCYRGGQHPLQASARDDLDSFLRASAPTAEGELSAATP